MNFFKKIFMKQDDSEVIEKIEREYIFNHLDLEQWCEPFFSNDFTTIAYPELSNPEYARLHKLFSLGADVVPHVASNTSIGIFICSVNFDSEDVVRTAIIMRHAFSSSDAIIMDAVIWKRDNTVETIPFRLNIRPDDEHSRLASALISVQKEIPFYFGLVEDGLFTIEKRILSKVPGSVQEEQQIMLVELYTDELRKSGPFIEMKNISDREMTTAGWVWHFDNEQLKAENDDLSLIKIKILRTIFDKINRFSEAGYFTGWVGENVNDKYGTGPYKETTTFILTSSEPLHMKEKLHQEIMEYLKSVKGYIREDGGYPLKYESIPLLRRGENGFGFVSVDEEFLTRVDELYRRMKSQPNNFYCKLLNINKVL